MRLILNLLIVISLFYPALFLGQNSSGDYRQKVLEDVRNQLVMSCGKTMNEPEILMLEREFNVASYSSSNIIRFEKKAYEICQSFGEDSTNAMAYLIAHELGHKIRGDLNLVNNCSFYAERSFKGNDSTSNAIKKTINNHNRKLIEATADESACLMTQIAGYKSIKIVPKLLEKIYKKYNYDDNLNDYPSLDERINISKKAIEHTNNLIPLFKKSNIAFILGEYDIAIEGFKKLEDKFPSREMYMNIGTCYASKALEQINKHYPSLVYPFEIDTETRLLTPGKTRGGNSFGEEYNNEIKNQLKKACKHFENACIIDENYFLGFINRAMCYGILQEKYFNNESSDHKKYLRKEKFYLNEAEDKLKKTDDFLLFEIYNVIRDYKSSKNDSLAIESFKNIDHPIAECNILKLRGDQKTNVSNKKIVFEMPLELNKWLNFDYKEVENINKIQGININDSFEEIERKLGDPNRKIKNYDKTYLIYNSSNLIILENNKSLKKSYIYYYKD